MNKLLIICGPTATGKTKLALSLAKKINGELVSADSRQVYKGLDIITGKDLPQKVQSTQYKVHSTFKNKRYVLNTLDFDGVPLWMYDVVNPDEEFSVAHYQHLATNVIDEIRKRGKLPIVVGGTGLYIQSLTKLMDLVRIPRNNALRKSITTSSIGEFGQKLHDLDLDKWNLMNHSDRNNTRRLIRAIEIAVWKKSNNNVTQLYPRVDTCWIGLTLPLDKLAVKIKARVQARLEEGAIDEVRRLTRKRLSQQLPSLSAFGISLIQNYISGALSKNDLIDRWTNQEVSYVKSQMTWFKKQSGVQWFSADDPKLLKLVQSSVSPWYTSLDYDLKN